MNQPSQEVSLRTLQIIWGALVASVGIYFFVLKSQIESLGAEASPTADPNLPLLVPFAVMAMGCAAASFLLPSLLLKQSLRKKGSESPSEAEGLRLYFMPFVISMALQEAIVLYGFILGFMARSNAPALPFMGLGLLLMLINFPTQDKINQLVEKSKPN